MGGFARVLRAYDESLDDAVAIKVLAENWAADLEIRNRFLEEARLLRRVRSEHLVTVHDIGELADGRPYFVMEFADAGTLAARLKSRASPGLDAASARAIVEALAEGLGALHTAGVVHRDVNPKNLLLRRGKSHRAELRSEQATQLRPGLIATGERILLGDLGLAKDVVRSGSNAVSMVGGTANYIPPEQLDPDGLVGPEADVYAASGVLWECLTGTPPPNPTTIGTASTRLDQKWRAFFAIGLAVEAQDRYPTMDKWRAAALDCIVGDGPIGAVAGRTTRIRAGEESPYLGLAAFQPEDADRFFGRSALIKELVDRLRAQRTLVVGGPSGSGKSSLVRAGLIPSIAGGVLAGSERWPVALFTPGSDPLKELAYQLSKLAVNVTQQASRTVTGVDLVTDPNRGRLLVETLSDTAGGVMLVIDQFEELFTQGPDRTGQQAFLDVLAALVDPADSKVRLVIAVRADFYGTCASFPWLAEKITANQVLVGPMTRPELREATEEPARRAGLVIEAGVVDAVLDEGGAEPGTLPLVSHALAETWRRRRGSVMTMEGYREAGGVSGAIARTANALYDDRFDGAEREAVRRLMLRLVNPGEGTPDTRRSLPAASLDADNDAVLKRVAHEMTEARLLTATEDTIEIAHEALIRTWPRLRQWIEESRDDLRMRQHIARAASEWVEQDRDSDLLYRGTPLDAALEWAESSPDVLEASDQEFLDASRQARDDAAAEAARREARSRRLRTSAIAVLSVLTLVAVGAGIAAFNASRQANARFSQSLGAQAANLATENPRVALALAVEAIERGQTDSFEARTALVEASRALGDLPLAPAASKFAVGEALSIAVAPDGSSIAAGYVDGSVKLWEPRLGEVIGEPLLGHAGAVNDVAFTPDGRFVLSASNDGTVRKWDVSDPAVATGDVVGEHDGIVWRLAISPDGSRLASASEDGTVREWELQSGTPVGDALVDSSRDFLSVAYSPDGSLILAGNGRGELHGWDTTTRQAVLPMFNAHQSDLWNIAFDPTGSMIATSSSDGTVLVWEASGGLIGEAYAGKSPNGAGITFLPDGRLVVGSGDGRVGVWSRTGERLQLMASDHEDEVVDAVLTPDGAELVTLSADQTVRLWTRPQSAAWLDLAGLNDGAYGVALAPSGVVAVGDGRGTVRLYQPGAATGDQISGLEHSGPASSLSFNEEGTALASGGSDGSWWLADVSTRSARIGPVAAHDGPIAAIAMAGQLVITGGGDGLVRVWNEDGSLLRELADRHAGGVTSLAIDGDRLATSDRKGDVRLYDVASGELLTGPIAADDNTIWDMDFSPNGTMLATASADEVVTIWDLGGFEPIATLTPHGTAATGVAFLDDVTVVSLDVDGVVRLWDVALGRQLGGALVGHTDASWGLAAGGGSVFVTTSLDGSANAWNIVDLETACAKAEGAFDAEQQRRYLGDDEVMGCGGRIP